MYVCYIYLANAIVCAEQTVLSHCFVCCSGDATFRVIGKIPTERVLFSRFCSVRLKRVVRCLGSQGSIQRVAQRVSRWKIGDILYEGLSGYNTKSLAMVGNVLGECHAPCMISEKGRRSVTAMKD